MNTYNHGNFLDTPKLQPGITRLWFIRHAIVEENARMRQYGALDVPLCPDSLIAQRPMYSALAARLPQNAQWIVSPLSRTHQTAEAIQEAGYGKKTWAIEEKFTEQSLGQWHGLLHEELPAQLTYTPHIFWPVAASERPPGGESMLDVCGRVAVAMDNLSKTYDGKEIVVVSHGGAIRAALAHALQVHINVALHFAIQNLSLTIIERHPDAWRVVAVNEMPGI